MFAESVRSAELIRPETYGYQEELECGSETNTTGCAGCRYFLREEDENAKQFFKIASFKILID
jgi:hypothetical protein